jgi:hypothetical protein
MHPEEIAVLGLIVAVFLVFGVTLAWVTYERAPGQAAQRRGVRDDHASRTPVNSAMTAATQNTD